MPTRRNSEIAGPRFRGRPALFAALIALMIGAAAPAASAATTNPGELYAFGNNYFGQLGSATNNGTSNANPTPALVNLPGASGPLTEIAAGGFHSLALTTSGQLYAFGDNQYGQLGNATNNGTEEPNPTPTLVSLPGASGAVAQIAAGREHSLALTSTGQLFAFGNNQYGQLGNATNNENSNPNPTPVAVVLPGASGAVTQIAAGALHSLALTTSGQLYAFGDNQYGQLGNATNNGMAKPNPTPALVTLPGASGAVTQIAGGGSQSLVLTSSGQLYAFGDNQYGQLGTATNAGMAKPNPTPALVTLPGASGAVTQIAGGGFHSLALTSTGQLYAFGENNFGQLGSATNNESSKPNPTPAPASLPGASGAVTQIAAGGFHSLALTTSGQLYAFGNNGYGQLGNATNSGTDNPNPTPAPVDLGAGTTIDTVAHGPAANYTLALVADLAVTNNSLPRGRVGAPYNATATAAGGAEPYSWQASGLPPGLSIDAGGQISGRPKKAGTAQVQLGVSDRFGIVASSPPLALAIAARPAIAKLRQSHRRWRRGPRLAKVSSAAARRKGGRAPLGTTFSFKLNTQARVKFAFARRKGKRFRKAGALTFAGHRGKNRVRFQGRISRRKRLQPGRYRLTATAKSGGERSKPRSLRFTIMR
jgi:alpha-tubulin suppressor-like RCC1 family protein